MVVPNWFQKDGPMARLTKKIVDAANAQNAEYVLWDDELRGFGLRVHPSGVKSYLVKYRVGRGRYAPQRKQRIGVHGSPWSLDQARKEALRMLALASTGVDPARAVVTANEGLLLAAFADRYMTEHAEPRKKASSAAEDRRLLDRDVLPKLGSRRVVEIGLADIEKLHRSMKATPHKANRVRALLSKMFALAEQWGLREPNSNPCRAVGQFRETARQRYLSNKEIGALATALETLSGAGEHPAGIAIIRLLMLTGARKGEILSLRWDELDLTNAMISKRDSKTGAKKIVLTDAAALLLKSWPRLDATWVFPASRGDSHYQGLTKVWLRVRAEAGLSDVRLHDLRHTYASVAIRDGVPLAHLGRLLGHKNARTTERYAHLGDDPVRLAAANTSSAIDAAMKGGEG